MYRILHILAFLLYLFPATVWAQTRQWTAGDGMPTGEVQQIIPLPNGQLLLNCEGVFCLTNGADFTQLPLDFNRVHQLHPFTTSYGHLWEGDSLLWIHDYHRLYLFDARTRSFLYDIEPRIKARGIDRLLVNDKWPTNVPERLYSAIDSLDVYDRATTFAFDHQGGAWVGTRRGVNYFAPVRQSVVISHNNDLSQWVRSTMDRRGQLWSPRFEGLFLLGKEGWHNLNLTDTEDLPINNIYFVHELPDRRYLLCHHLNQLGYFSQEARRFSPLNPKLPALDSVRYIVGACSLNKQWTILYSQNGAFLLDTQADTLAVPHFRRDIERYSRKYNCMLKGSDNTLWVGTQNGLFKVTGKRVLRISGLANNCIRSLTHDAEGHVWAATSGGISRITPSVLNFGQFDGIPKSIMMERSARCRTDSMLVFAITASETVLFRPEWLVDEEKIKATPPVLTEVWISDSLYMPQPPAGLTLDYKHNYLTFHFSVLDYANPSHVRYRYRLSGLENDWHDAIQGEGFATADYTALPPGHYTFEAQAAIADSGWSETVCMPVIIHPPFWLTWWAKAIYAIIAISTIIGLVAFYLRNKRKKLERENDVKVHQLFELREEARHQFAQSANIDPQKIGINPQEEDLVKKLLAAIETHLNEEEYSIDQLSNDVAMSRSVLYRKMQAMLGITPSDFVRSVRLKHSAHLLQTTDLPINEIASRVGFATSRNYSTNFKKMFGVLPSEYRGK